MSVTDEDIQAFADGMLDAEAAERVGRAVAADPALQKRVERMRRAAAALRSAFDGVLDDPAPERLAALLADEAPRGQVIAFPKAHQRALWAMAAAACLMLAFVGGRLAAPDQPVRVADGRIVATGSLENALNSASSGAAGAVRVALSFDREGGGYCRVFRLDAGRGSAGLACGSRNDWTIVALADAPRIGTGGAYQQAAGDLPRTILDAAAEQRAGDPLDAAAERNAIRNGWRATRQGAH